SRFLVRSSVLSCLLPSMTISLIDGRSCTLTTSTLPSRPTLTSSKLPVLNRLRMVLRSVSDSTVSPTLSGIAANTAPAEIRCKPSTRISETTKGSAAMACALPIYKPIAEKSRLRFIETLTSRNWMQSKSRDTARAARRARQLFFTTTDDRQPGWRRPLQAHDVAGRICCKGCRATWTDSQAHQIVIQRQRHDSDHNDQADLIADLLDFFGYRTPGYQLRQREHNVAAV